MKRRARLHGRVREAAGIGERLDGAGALVEQSAEIGAGADAGRGLGRAEQAHRRAARLPLPFALLKLLQPGLVGGAVQRAGMLGLAVDAVAADEIEDDARPLAQRREQPLAMLGPEDGRHVVRHDPQAGIDEADIAAGAAEADIGRLQHHDGDAGLGQMQRRRQAGIARADDDHVGAQLSGKRARRRRGRRGLFPKPVCARIVLHASIFTVSRAKQTDECGSPHAPAAFIR